MDYMAKKLEQQALTRLELYFPISVDDIDVSMNGARVLIGVSER